MKRKLILLMSVMCITNLTACGKKQEALDPIVAESYDVPVPVTELETTPEDQVEDLSQYCFLETDFKANDVVYEDEYIKLTFLNHEKEHYIQNATDYNFDRANTKLTLSYEIKENGDFTPSILAFGINDIGGTEYGSGSTDSYNQTFIFTISDREARLYKEFAGDTPIQKMSLILDIDDNSTGNHLAHYYPITFGTSTAKEHYEYDLGTPIIDNDFCTIYDLKYDYTRFTDLCDAHELNVNASEQLSFNLMVYHKVPFDHDIYLERKDDLLNDYFNTVISDFQVDLQPLDMRDGDDLVANNGALMSRASLSEAYNIVPFRFDYDDLLQQQTHKISLAPYCRSYSLSAYDERVEFDYTDVVNEALENPVSNFKFAD